MLTSEKENDPEEEHGWSELPSDLIHLIVQKLPDLLDFVRIRTVCKSWRSAAPLSDPPHQLPWLLEYTERKYRCGLRKRQRYYSVSSGQTLTIPFKNRKPRLKCWMDEGLCSQYLTFADADNKAFCFLNPLTKDRFSIPFNFCTIMVENRNNPSLYNGSTGEWCSFGQHINDWVGHKGFFYKREIVEKMYCTTKRSSLENEVIVIKNQLDKDKQLAPRLRKTFLVESSQGLLRVLWFHDFHTDSSVKLSVFHIHRLDRETADGKPCWVRIFDIGNQIIFLEKTNGFSLTARPSSGFRHGCIYFIYPQEERPYVYDVLAGTVEMMPCPFERCAWFLPGL